MSTSLAFRSNKLCVRSNKLAVRAAWGQCTNSYDSYHTGYAWQSAAWSSDSIYWAYPSESGNVLDQAFSNMGSSSWISGAPAAILKVDHSHGCSVTSDDHRNRYNDYMVVEGARAFTKPTGYDTITEAYLKLDYCGRVAHTIARGINNYHELICNCFSGLFLSNHPAGYLNNIFLVLQFYVTETNYYNVVLTQSDLISLNGSNGKIDAGLGRFTYKMNGYITVTLPSQVIAMLNAYAGVNLYMYWNWDNAYVGGFCPYCLGDYTDTGYSSRIASRAVIDVMTNNAQNPVLFVR
jgi:hypothetical protein